MNEYDAMYTKDISKKRKKWNDCKVTLKKNTVFVKCDDCDSVSKRSFSFQGVLEEKFIPRLLEGDETRVGCYLIQILIEQPLIVAAKRETTITRGTKPRLLNEFLEKENTLIEVRGEENVAEHPFKRLIVENELFGESYDRNAGKTNAMITCNGKLSSTFGTGLSMGEIRIKDNYNSVSSSNRSSLIREVYNDDMSYSTDFLLSLSDEVNLNVANNVNDFEERAIRVLKLSNCSATSTKNSSIGRLAIANRTLPSLDRQYDLLRSSQIPLVHCMDLIVSPPRHGNSADRNAYYLKTGGGGEDQCTIDNSNETVKLYLKLPVVQRQAPPGCDAFSRGDLWAIWDATSTAGNDPSSEKLEYLENRRCGYPFPWWRGSIWQAVWLVRFVRHGVSGEGLAEVAFVCEESTDVTKTMGRLPIGKARGALDTRFLGIRLFSDGSTMAALDLLREGTLSPALRKQKSDANDEVLHFDGLSSSPAFRAILGLPVLRGAPTGVGLRARNDDQSYPTFPLVEEVVRTGVLKEVHELFRLNADQISVLRAVSLWFGGENCTADPCDNIILVQGVFGSGKSHMLAAVAVLVKRLSRLAAVTAPHCGPVRIMVSANTNVAVDRVLAQLLTELPGTVGESAASGSDRREVDWPSVVRVGAVHRVAKCLRPRLVVSGGSDGGSGQVEALMRQRSTAAEVVAGLAQPPDEAARHASDC